MGNDPAHNIPLTPMLSAQTTTKHVPALFQFLLIVDESLLT